MSQVNRHHSFRVYLVKCSDDSLYCGIAIDVVQRIIQHNRGTGSMYVRSRRPCRLLAQTEPMSKSAALKAEALIKKLPRLQKLPVLQSLDNGVRTRDADVANLSFWRARRNRRD